ncbi:MAG TPA: hypothetical protein VKB51_17735 [bacterium]|nr:hypothetical protein [bacterium]
MRYYLVLQPSLGHSFGPERSAWLDATLSQDRYDPAGTLGETGRHLVTNEEVTFGQLTVRYEQGLSGGDHWQATLGSNWLRQGRPDPDRWRRLTQQDRFVNTTYRLALGRTDWIEGSLEVRTQNITYTVDSPDYKEDATVGTVGARYEATFGAYQGGVQLNLARYNAVGRFARKLMLDTRLHLARALGSVEADLGWNVIAERFTEPNPDYGDARLKQTLRSWTLDVIWPMFRSLSAAVQLRRDDRSANVATAAYRNESLSLSLIHVY